MSMADLLDRLLTGILHRRDLRLDLLRRAHRITRRTALRLTLFNVPRLMSKATIGIPGGKLCPERGSGRKMSGLEPICAYV